MATNLYAFASWCHSHSEQWSDIAQGRKVNRKRGAWRRPQLSATVSKLERELRDQWEFLEHAIVLVLAGEEVPATQQTSSSTLSTTAALEHHGLSEEDADRLIDPGKLATILLLLAYFRRRQLELASETIDQVYQASRVALLKRLKQPNAPELPETEVLSAQVKTLYQNDGNRFYKDLLDDSPRSRGVRNIIEESATLGEAVLALRTLFDVEQYRLSMFSESLVHSSWMAGYRSAAVSGTASALAVGETPPTFLWSGPDDSRTCFSCRSMFREPVMASSLSSLPDPTTICEGRRACRHFWSIA